MPPPLPPVSRPLQAQQGPLGPRTPTNAWQTNILVFRYKTNNITATFGWAIECSTNLKDWTTLIYPVMEEIPTVYATEPKMFYRAAGRN